MKRIEIPTWLALALDAALEHLLEVGVVVAGLGGIGLLYSLGLLGG